ncbi:MAG: tripartite tricarboxylate transporter TctB family protein [Acetobacteraceae bacterium]
MAGRLRADTVTALLALALAAYLAYEAMDLGLGEPSDPGSGYIQFWTACIMGVLGLIQLVQSMLPGGDKTSLGSVFAGLRWGKVLYVVGLLVAYAAVLQTLGFVLTTFILLLILFKTVEPQGWGVSLIGSAVTTLVAWAVFVAWLGTQMPSGTLLGD